MTDVTEDPTAAAASAYAQMAMGAMFDLAAPQERYLELIANGGFVEPMPGMALSFRARTRSTCCAITRSSRRRST